MVGSVPYVNAKPLNSYFEHLGQHSSVRVLYQVPSSLPALLDSGTAEAVLVSSFDSLRTPGRRIAAGCSISTKADAQSVRLLSKVPIHGIQSVALDSSSLTSVHLAQVVLAESYGVRPEVRNMPPNQDDMLAACDAALLIGDIGMLADGTGLIDLDMGAEWHKLTNLPFVWAAWIGRERLTPALAKELERAKLWGQAHLDRVVTQTQVQCKWPGDSCREYLTEIMNYDLTEDHLAGLKLFGELLVKHGLLTEAHFPEIVAAETTAMSV